MPPHQRPFLIDAAAEIGRFLFRRWFGRLAAAAIFFGVVLLFVNLAYGPSHRSTAQPSTGFTVGADNGSSSAPSTNLNTIPTSLDDRLAAFDRQPEVQPLKTYNTQTSSDSDVAIYLTTIWLHSDESNYLTPNQKYYLWGLVEDPNSPLGQFLTAHPASMALAVYNDVSTSGSGNERTISSSQVGISGIPPASPTKLAPIRIHARWTHGHWFIAGISAQSETIGDM